MLGVLVVDNSSQIKLISTVIDIALCQDDICEAKPMVPVSNVTNV